MMNNCFHSVFLRVIASVREQWVLTRPVCVKLVTINEVRKIMEEQDVRKASGLDGVSN